MKKNLKKLAAISMAGIMAWSMTACGNSKTVSQETKDTAAKAETKEGSSEAGKVLNVHIDVEVASLDPQIATDGTSFEVIADTTDGLYELDADGNPIPALAESVEKSEDGLTLTYHLRDAKWSNGTPVTAKDFVFAWKRAVDPKTASEYAFIVGIAGIKNAEAVAAGEKPLEELGVTAVDDKTLKVELDVPVPYFESLMAFPTFYPVNQEFFEKTGDQYASTPDTLLSNGPYKITSYEPAATTITLEKNKDYRDADKVKLDGMKYQVIKDSQQAILAYQNGDLDVVTLSGEQVEQFQADPEFKNIMAGYLWYLSPNTKVKGLENLNLRKALSLCFDKEAVCTNILKDGSIPAYFAVPTLLATGPDGKDYRESAGSNYFKTDKAEALKYWEEAKKELGVDSLTYTMIVEDTESAINVAQFLQSEIQTTLPGITITLEQMPKKNRVERMQEGQFEIGLTRWGPDYADPMTYLDMWTTDSPNNYGFWSNKDYDSIIESSKKGELALDPAKRWKALIDAEKIVCDDAVIFPVYQKGNAVMQKANVEGIDFHSIAINRYFKNTVKN